MLPVRDIARWDNHRSPTCPADFNNDHTVGVADLNALLAAWGPCPPGPCIGDVDGDGRVGVPDQNALLAAWGPCPGYPGREVVQNHRDQDPGAREAGLSVANGGIDRDVVLPANAFRAVHDGLRLPGLPGQGCGCSHVEQTMEAVARPGEHLHLPRDELSGWSLHLHHVAELGMSERFLCDGRLDCCVRVCTYSAMEFVWDPEKAASNLRKHGVDFADAVLVLEDDWAVTTKDPFPRGEERFVTMGRDPHGRTLVVVFTWRQETVRLISARRATPRERRQYESRP